jgi:hypothetical protein
MADSAGRLDKKLLDENPLLSIGRIPQRSPAVTHMWISPEASRQSLSVGRSTFGTG